MPYTIGIGTHVQRPYSLCSRVGVRVFLTVGCQKHGRGHILRCISMGYRCERECLRTLRHSDELTGTFVSGWQGAQNNARQIPRTAVIKREPPSGGSRRVKVPPTWRRPYGRHFWQSRILTRSIVLTGNQDKSSIARWKEERVHESEKYIG